MEVGAKRPFSIVLVSRAKTPRGVSAVSVGCLAEEEGGAAGAPGFLPEAARRGLAFCLVDRERAMAP